MTLTRKLKAWVGSPEGKQKATKGRRYFDRLNKEIYIKDSGGTAKVGTTTGWRRYG